MIKASHIIIGLLAIILILAVLLIVRKPNPVVEPFDDTQLREEIRVKDSIADYWQAVSEYWEAIAVVSEAKSDSLQSLKPTIKYKYEKIYEFNAIANDSQLDSVIRSNW